jgi:6-phospho-beta-glucosidase
VALGYARLIETVAPEAVLVNFTNPVGIVVQALNDHSSVRAIGVCDGPIEMKRGLAAFLGVPGDEVQVSYAGLNHCGWIHRVRVDGRDRLPEILDRYEELHATGESWSMFDPALVRTIGMLPMEYLYFYYYRREALEHVRASGGTRGRQVADLNASMWPELGRRIAAGDPAGARAVWERAIDERHETYFARERGDAFRTEAPGDEPGELFEGDGYEGVATAVMASIIGDRRAPLIVNARNDGAIEGLRADDVVEVTCDVDGDGAHAMEQGRLPDAAYALIEPVKAYERLTVEAAVEGSYGAALEALLVHPLVGSYRLSKDILDEYLAAHGDLLAHIRR